MNEERRRVLEMVAAGTITPEQGDELLDALGTEPVPKPEVTATRASSRQRKPKFTSDELVRLGTHGVDAAYMRGLRDAGLSDLTADEIIQLYNHGIDPAFVAEMRDMGYIDLTSDELIELQNQGVGSDFVREILDEEATGAGR
jgi:hypothetical protein